jgi:hypothetical protein
LLPGDFTGTGDCAAALLLAWTHKLGPGQGKFALENCMKSIQGMIMLTMKLQLERKRMAIKDRVPISRTGGNNINDSDIDKYLLPCEIPRFVHNFSIYIHVCYYYVNF